MNQQDKKFAGAIPALYDDYLGPVFFEPYARDIAARLKGHSLGAVLETAAGTGIVTAALIETLPVATRIVATDLNEPMLQRCLARSFARPVEGKVVDAQKLPFDDATFDAVVCQFGVMFFPDKVAAYREACRVLRPGGRYVFNVWGALEDNVLSKIISDVAIASFPDDPPRFIERTPFGYHDVARITAELTAAGFTRVESSTVDLRAHCPSAAHGAVGICQGTPLRNELEARGPDAMTHVTESATRAVAERYGAGGFDHEMRAYVLTAFA